MFVIFHLHEVSHNLDFTHNLYGVIELKENVLNSFDCNNFPTFAVYGLYDLAIGTSPNKLRKLIFSLKQLPCIRQAGHLLLRLFLLSLLHSFILNILFLITSPMYLSIIKNNDRRIIPYSMFENIT